MALERRLQVFVSSTYTDLLDERKAAVEAILEAGHIPAGMELFTAGDITQWQLIKRWIEESDVYVLLLGARYGSIGPKGTKSYTHMEFDYAKKLKKPRFSLLADDTFLEQSRKKHNVKPAEVTKANRFRKLISGKTVSFFSNRDQVKTKVTQSLTPFATQPGISGWIRASVSAGSTLLFPQSYKVGHGLLPDVEQSHNVSAIANMLWDRPSSLLQIGSPYLRYWLTSADPKLQWLLENTKHIKMEVALFEKTAPITAKYEKERNAHIQACRAISRQFPKRLSFRNSSRPSDLSYIIYPLKDQSGATSRAMIGIQTRSYADRPFLELVYTKESPPPLVRAAINLHGELF
ncbi:DUF4062 domain-containing protein [Bradyrhizobium yuanmingense]|uniref:DUF4062 domain-containing protein n=1 Tax=Bradyrhizobium yuanmingense TaxID=108015 RepID=UPI0012F8D641|nr:DUF4062 domain-containing protein [Bradyrhizobium yuanmingense]MVT52576.1 DUF4062 domain-containing protein [Bradyrhizobium yuanmingense]